MAKKQYAVIGLGRFGSSLATALYEAKNEVIGIDINEERVEEFHQDLSQAVIADSTDKQSMKSLGITNFDVVIVAMGDDMQSSIFTVVVLKELGVQYIVAKALDNRHGAILSKVGADQVVYPERDMGLRVAQKLMQPNIIEYIQLSKEYSIEEIMIPSLIVGKTLKELDVRARFNVNVIAIRHHDEKVTIAPGPDFIFKDHDSLVVIGQNNDLKEFAKFNS
ncbi:potassium channel family protein [Metabacillus sp. RGM 3146]|uniref:potassium channel family protein n=1 Tax=Metabacillus sp. RGM 3146 TaxID=3401092 RepID=UPI003B99DB39